MDEAFIKALAERVKLGEISLDSMPEPTQVEVQALIDAEGSTRE